jgi:uncharacterized membrane protein
MPRTQRHPLHGLHWSARLSAFQRQVCALGVGLLVGCASIAGPASGGEAPWLAGWLGYSVTYLCITWPLAMQLDAAATQRRAQWIDPGTGMIFVLVAAAACASIVAVALAVETSRSLLGLARWAYIALAMGGLAASWLLLQTVFGLHYARLYYGGTPSGGEVTGGLAFPGGKDPDYLDFFYFSAVIGMTSQVSDVAVTDRPMRRLTLLHSVASFAFNLLVLALAVNVFASSLAG